MTPFCTKSFSMFLLFLTSLSIELGILIFNSYISYGTKLFINRLTCCSLGMSNGQRLTKFHHLCKNVTKDYPIFCLVVKRSIIVTLLSMLKAKWQMNFLASLFQDLMLPGSQVYQSITCPDKLCGNRCMRYVSIIVNLHASGIGHRSCNV